MAMGSEEMGIDITKACSTKSKSRRSRGFTLIASLLMMLLLSGIAIGLMMMVNTEGKVGGTDMQNNLAYHAAEGGIEKMYSDLTAVFQNAQAPTPSVICGVGAAGNQPSMVGVTWTQYSVMPGSNQSTTGGATCPTSLTATWGQVTAGQNKNLWAQVIPVNMLVTAQMLGGQEVSMVRTAQVALIPVFQFGVFSESDLSYFSGQPLDFAGRVHTNGDLYPFVTGGNTLTFHADVSAYGNIVRTQLPNGLDATADYNGAVYVSKGTGAGCLSPPTGATSTCILMATNSTSSPYGDGSVTGAGSPKAQSGANYNSANWGPFSTSTASQMINGNYGSQTTPGTGAARLSMPFVSGTTLPNELIRLPQSTDTTTLTQSREYNMAEIHVLLADDPADLPGGASDTGNIRLANLSAAQVKAQNGNVAGTTSTNQWGIPIAAGNFNSATFGSPTGTNTYNLYFAAASNVIPNSSSCLSSTSCAMDWPYAPIPWTANPNPSAGSDGLQPQNPSPGTAGNTNAPTYSMPTNAGLITGLCPPSGVTLAGTVTPPTGCPALYPYFPIPNRNGGTWNDSQYATSWSLIDGYLRVEYKDKTTGNWTPVTLEWLKLGFARGTSAPTAPQTNPYTKNAILLLQEPADRDASGGSPTPTQPTPIQPTCATFNGSGKCLTWTGKVPELIMDLTSYAASSATTNWAFGLTPAAPVATPLASATQQSITQYNWYPINFYDVREGEVRDNVVNDNSCTVNGVMNAVEIDVGNLKLWLNGTIAGSGQSVDSASQNGYVLYFSDRRGMLRNPNAGNLRTGEAGLEDVVNRSSGLGTPDGVLETPPSGRKYSPEDVNQNGVLDTWGVLNMGLGFWNDSANNLNTLINLPANNDPYGTAGGSARITSCANTARKNWVSGARHVLRLVDGSYNNVPLSPTPITVNGVTYNGGFTVASENPVYVWGDYNTNATDWTKGDEAGHAAAAVIADAVTLLSDDWTDNQSMIGNYITTLWSGTAATSTTRNPSHDGFYRLAIAGGKNMTFQLPTFTTPAAPPRDFGTDGGLHNFLRYLENWGSQTVNYKGSLVSLYYSTYNTGTFKCCSTVYGVPTRDYIFDNDFTVPAGLPPGTPLFRDVESLGYRQVLAPRRTSE
jgi:Tfp pilus assembly protein PilX